VLNWHFFLSHAAGEQGPTVQFIDHKLKDRGFSVWFDQSNGRAGKNRAQTNAAEAEAGLDRGGGGVGGGAVIDVTKAGMERGVQQSAIFVLVLSKSVFTRRFCRLEILAALQARRPFVTLHEADARYGKWDFAAPTVGAPECWHAIIGQIMAEVTSLPLRRDEEEHELMMSKLVRRLREQRGVVLDVPAAVLQVAAAEVRQALAPSAVDESSSASGGGGGAAALPPSPPPPRVDALLTGAGDATEWMALRAASVASAAAAAGTIADDVVTYAALQRAMQRRFARVVLTHTTPGVKPRALTTSDFLVLETYTKRRASIGVSLVHRVTRKGEPLVHLLAWAKFLYKWLQPWMGLVRFILPAWNCFVIPSAAVSPPSLSGSGGGESECVGGASSSSAAAAAVPFVRGFVSTPVTNKIMQRKGSGRFLLRFSASKPTAVAIAYHTETSLESSRQGGLPPTPKQTLVALQTIPGSGGRMQLVMAGGFAFASLGAVLEAETLPTALTHLSVDRTSAGASARASGGGASSAAADVPKECVLREWRKSGGESAAAVGGGGAEDRRVARPAQGGSVAAK
jgi:hypothetical protein